MNALLSYLQSRSLATHTLFFFAAFLVGACILLLLSVPFTVYLVQNGITKSERATEHVLKTLTAVHSLNYGIIEAVADTTLTVRLRTAFGDAGQMRVVVDPEAQIMYQELRGDGGVYDSISERRSAALADLSVGDRVAMYLIRDEAGTLHTKYMLFGNPL